MKKQRWLKLFSCLMCVVLCAGLTGCAGKGQTTSAPAAQSTEAAPVTLNITMDQGTSNGLTALAEAFMAQYPNVTINISYLAWENLANSVGDDTVSDPVDGFMVSFREELYTEKFLSVWREKCEDFAKTDVVDLTRFNKGALEALNAEGCQYGLPLTTSSFGVIANMNILAECGITEMPGTIQEFLDACAKIKAQGYKPVQCSASSLPYLLTAITAYELKAQGKEQEFIDATLHSGTAAIGEYYRSALELVTTLVAQGYLDPAATAFNPEANDGTGAEEPVTSYKQECYGFLNGDVAFYPEYTDILSSLQKREKKSAAYLAAPFDYQFFPAPTSYGPSLMQTGSYGLYVIKTSAKLDWMNRFVQFVFAQSDASPVGNVAYFSDSQFAMSPFDNEAQATDISRKYYSEYIKTFEGAETCPADYKEILAYHGYGICTGPLFDLFTEQDVWAMDADALVQAIDTYMYDWFVAGNIKE